MIEAHSHQIILAETYFIRYVLDISIHSSGLIFTESVSIHS
jgi:hypothetical protein